MTRKFQIGEYVKYKNVVYVVVKLGDDARITLHPGKSNKKVRVSINNKELSKIGRVAKVIQYEDRPFIVSKHGLIISVTTGKISLWAEGNPVRNKILALANL